MDLGLGINQTNNMTLINLRKKFRDKQQIIKFFQAQSKITIISDLIFPEYDCYDFQYFIQVLTGNKGVSFF